MKLIKFILILLIPLNAYAADDNYLELMEQWSISPDQQKLVPISSPVEIKVDTIDGKVSAVFLDVTNTQPPSMLSNKAVVAGKSSVWLRSVSIVIRPKQDFPIWLPGEHGEKDRKGAQPFTLQGEAKVDLEVNGAMTRAVLPMTLNFEPYSGGYGAKIIYTGDRKPKNPDAVAMSVLTESGSNPEFTIQAFERDYSMTVKGRVDIKMSDYKQLYEGTWDVKQ